MNTYISLILTAIVTISTIIYTICSIQSWRTTRAAAEISRQAAFSNLWAELNRYLEILRQQDAPETAFLQKVSDLTLEFMVANLVAHAVEKNDPALQAIDVWLSTAPDVRLARVVVAMTFNLTSVRNWPSPAMAKAIGVSEQRLARSKAFVF